MVTKAQGEVRKLSSRVYEAVRELNKESLICHRASSGLAGTECSFLSKTTFVRFCIANQARRRSMEQHVLCSTCGIGHSIIKKKEEGRMPTNVRFLNEEE